MHYLVILGDIIIIIISLNMLYHNGLETCVSNCKYTNYLRQNNECINSCHFAHYLLKFPSNQDDLCVDDCLMFGKAR